MQKVLRRSRRRDLYSAGTCRDQNDRDTSASPVEDVHKAGQHKPPILSGLTCEFPKLCLNVLCQRRARRGTYCACSQFVGYRVKAEEHD